MVKNKLKIFESAALIALCAALCAGTWAQGRQSALSGNLVRLHVLAHSDDIKEQQIKLQVRDAVLDYLQPRLEEAASQEEATLVIQRNIEGIEKAASLVSQGREVSVWLGRENYPTREYPGFALPAGEYSSLRVVLGEGQGENWWCVVFPPLCTEAVSRQSVYPTLSSEDMALISQQGGYRLAFRSIELFNALKQALDRGLK